MRLSNFLAIFLIPCLCLKAEPAEYSTANFVVTAPTVEFAQKCGLTAEYCRETIAKDWLGKKMPNWYSPCTMTVRVGQIGAGGSTTFAFDRGEVFGWRMNVQGSEERILDSVIPHEVTHTIFACHFRRPLPRWADEGAATLIEHESERRRQALIMQQQWTRRYPLGELLGIKEYPKDMNQVLTLYSQGYLLTDYLVERGGKARYLAFLDTAHQRGWDHAVTTHYGFRGVAELEASWGVWVPKCWGQCPTPNTQPPYIPEQPLQPIPETEFIAGPPGPQGPKGDPGPQGPPGQFDRAIIRVIENNTERITSLERKPQYNDSELRSRIETLESRTTVIVPPEAKDRDIIIKVVDENGKEITVPVTVKPNQSKVTIPIKRELGK